ncbi:carbohydrate binding domain-containing protein [Niallia circulans]|uniref:carbohydrate binding domain-containing protein n=1 Tax=Niallia circulans TaxID=1397 RepID=UPI0035256F27
MIFFKKISYLFLIVLTIFSGLTFQGSNEQHQVKAETINLEESDFSWDNATVYFAMTDRFADGKPANNNSYGRPQTDANGSNIGTFHGGDLKGLTNKLDEGYFTDLGINAIWITAPYEQIHGWVGGGNSGDFAHYSYHGYYALDYTMVDQNMGTVDEMREFVNKAHERGIRVIMDVVMNHAGYNTIKDMHEYNFGNPGVPETWTPGSGQSWHDVHNYINYDDANAWKSWWGDWVKAGIGGYTQCGNDDKNMCLSGLPDFRTDVTQDLGLPNLLKNKWNKEQNGSYDSWIVPAAKDLRKNLGVAPADYITKWLSSWVEEFGIDGFRVDTAKHVEIHRWKQLKEEANDALWKWRANNPDAPGAQWDDDFWMTGEVWGHGVGKSEYFYNGFDSIINFTFQGEGANGPAYNLASMEDTFSHYASKINTDPDFNVLSYLSQHDTSLYPRDRLIDGGTYLMLLPGGIQIFYGDETARPFGPTGSDPNQGTRSSMNWDSINEQVLTHWQKMGQFRNRHQAIGAGEHKQIGNSPYTFSRTLSSNELDDRVVVAVGASGKTTIDVSSVFNDGDKLKDFYTGNTATVQNGKVTFTPHKNGVLLIEREGEALPSISVTPNSSEFDTEELEIYFSLKNTAEGYYTVDGSDPSENGTAFVDGEKLSIGKSLEIGETLVLKLYAENDSGPVAKEYTYKKIAPLPKVSANPPGGTFYDDTVDVTLDYQNVEEAFYKINEGEPVAYTKGKTISLGADTAVGDEIILTLTAKNQYGEAEKTYTFTKIDGLTIYFKKPDNWSTPHLYYYDTEPKVDEPSWNNAPKMEHYKDDWYVYTVKGTESMNVIFKDANNQWPGPNQPGFIRSTSGWFDGEWHDSDPTAPVVPSAPKNLKATEVNASSVTLNWEASSANVSHYAVYRDAEKIGETSTTSYKDTGVSPQTEYEYYVIAINDIGKSKSSNIISVTTTEIRTNEVTIYYKGVENPYIHYQVGDGDWTHLPGKKMEQSSIPAYYVTTIPLGEADKINAAFNNGQGKWDNNNGKNYAFTNGTFTVDNGQLLEGEPPSTNKVTIYYYTGWNEPRIHYSPYDGHWSTLPGTQMSKSDYPGYFVITLDIGTADGLEAAFNNGNNSWDNNQGSNYHFKSGEYILKNGQVTRGHP